MGREAPQLVAAGSGEAGAPEPCTTDRDLAAHFSGEKLYGDDLGPAEIERWFEEEREGYADLGARDREKYVYPYHALDRRHLFRFLPAARFPSALSIGGAYGHELLPLLGRIDEITIVEPSEAFTGSRLGHVPVRYVAPSASGLLPFADRSFDLACALSVLHHIPNVSVVLREIHRCLKPGGWALLREPTTSMGDWRRPRRGLTRHERGLPLQWFRLAVTGAGFQVARETRCLNAVTPRLGKGLPGGAYNSEFLVTLDSALTRLISWNRTYHARTLLQRVRPWAVAYVLRKPAA